MDRDFCNTTYKADENDVIVADRLLDSEFEGLTLGTALDLGCGTGPNALNLAAKGWSVLGVDWAEHAIELATEFAEQSGLNAKFVIGDITSCKPPDKFDHVISTYALPGGEGTRRALQTAIAALYRGGTLIVAEWDRSIAEVWGFSADDLPTPEQIVSLMPGLIIEKAVVKRIQDMFPSPDDRRRYGSSATNIAFVRAKKS